MGAGGTPIEDAMVDILEMMRSQKYDLASLVTHEYKVDQIAEALVMGSIAREAQKVAVSF
jgi:Zn-dependent alcohol dehydrogenase